MSILLDRETKFTGMNKFEKQDRYLQGCYLQIHGEQGKVPLQNLVVNYVFNVHRYRAETRNRVHGLEEMAREKGLSQLFVTLTLPTEYHQHSIQNGIRIENPNFAHGHLELYDIETRTRAPSYLKMTFKRYKRLGNKWTGKFERVSLLPEDYSPNMGAKKLTQMFAKVRKDRSWTKIPKDHRIYFAVMEPTQNATPHMHISIWVPFKASDSIISVFCRFFPYPWSHIYTQYIPMEYTRVKKSKKHVKEDDTSVWIEKSDKDIIKYPLKYLNHLQYDDRPTEQALWYLVHKITPFTCSRSLISLDIYRKLSGIMNICDATKLYNDQIIVAWDDVATKRLKKVIKSDSVIWSAKTCTLKKSYIPTKQEVGK